MNNKKRKLGLVLGGGAARGLAHIGIIKALSEENIPIEMIAGTSIGALVGACFAREGRITDIEELALNTDWRHLTGLIDTDVTQLSQGIIPGNRVKGLLSRLIGHIEFRDLKIPLSVIACDVDTGEEIIIRRGSVVEAVRASISLPGVFIPVQLNKRFLIDGSMINPVPIDVARDMGADFTIACNAIHKPLRRAPFAPKNKKKLEPPNIFDILFQSFNILEYAVSREQIKQADLVITPKIGHIAALEFYRAKEAIEAGYKAAKKAIGNEALSRFINRGA